MTLAAHLSESPFTKSGLLGEFFRRSPAFASAGLFVALLAVPAGAAWLLDARQLAGVAIWDKPLKFMLALSVYLFTLAWYEAYVPQAAGKARWRRVHSGVVIAAIVLELAVISGAAALGTASHFNASSPAWQITYGLMGIGAVLLTSASAVQGWLIARGSGGLSPVLRLALALGLLMTLPLTLWTAGYMSAQGGHLVGGNLSDAEGIFLMGWARDGGDLRVAHFFGSHALHFIPAFGLVSQRVFGRNTTLPVWLFAVGFTGFVGFTFLEALAGQPFLNWIG
ncbi:MAG: hypothetical protein WAT78_09965 [Rhizobiaceae bacterium]